MTTTLETPATLDRKLGVVHADAEAHAERAAMQRYLSARDAYLRELHRPPSRWERVCMLAASVWPRIRCHVRALAVILLMAALCLAVAMAKADSAEVPRWVLRGIAAVETRTDWRDIGDLTYRDRRIGADGEVGPWQLSPAALRNLKAFDRRHRIHADPVLAESLTRAWLLHLYARTGSWWEACAAFNAGLGNRWSAAATDYANRVTAAGIAAEAYGASPAAGAANGGRQ